MKLSATMFVVSAFGTLTAAPHALAAVPGQSLPLIAQPLIAQPLIAQPLIVQPNLAADTGQINWITAPDEMSTQLNIARTEGRPILVVFHADWCPWCVRMDTETFQNPDVIQLMQQFTCLRVDTTTPFGAALQRRMGIDGIPATLLYHGTQYQKVDGFTDPTTFAQDLRAIL